METHMAGTIKETWPLMDLLLNAKSLKSDPATMTHWTYMAGFAAQSQARRPMCIAFNTPPPPPQTRGSRMGDVMLTHSTPNILTRTGKLLPNRKNRLKP